MEPVRNLSDAMYQAGKLGHVNAVWDRGGDGISYQVRKGFGNWLVHVVKWYCNKSYKDRIIRQRANVLSSLDQLCGSQKPPGTQGTPVSDRRTKELHGHLEHGYRFQAQSIHLLRTLNIPKQEAAGENNAVAEKLIARQFKTDDAALKNLHFPERGNDPNLHEGVDKEKFGAAYWQYATGTVVDPAEFSTSFGSFSQSMDLNDGAALLEYALSKDGNEDYKGSKLYQHRGVQRDSNPNIDFETWGIPDGINNIELRLIHGSTPLQYARIAVRTGAKGQKALADRREQEGKILRTTDPDTREIYMKSHGLDVQLSDLCEQFMREEGIGGASVSFEQNEGIDGSLGSPENEK